MLNEKIIKICEQKFIYLNYSPQTKENYMCHIKSFVKSIGNRQIIHLNSKDFQTHVSTAILNKINLHN